MGFFGFEALPKLQTSNPVRSLYSCAASLLGFEGSVMETASSNLTQELGLGCANNSCYKPCSALYTEFGAVFASFSYLLLVVSSIQLMLVMFHDSLQEGKRSRLKMAFRITIQKCLLGAVILATGSRAIYYTVQGFIPDRWGDILLNIYYPSFLSAFSLLICFWAEFFYTSSNLEGRDFLNKHEYSLTYLVFNGIVYLLLVADIIATPLISDQEQVRLSGIVGTIFAFFLFVTLVGFLHFSIRLFFRPDWQPLFVQLAVLRINLRQQLASVLGVLSNALMQSLIICLLVFNMVVRYIPVNSYSLYICAVVIRVTELIMPLWFCCSLWNFKQPKRLWILNPGLILRWDQPPVDDVESKPLLSAGSHNSTHRHYGTVEIEPADNVSLDSSEDGCCWVCLGNDNPSDLFYPCNCQLHRECIKQWVAKRASDVNVPKKEYIKCQVCRRKYRVKRDGFLCFSRGMKRSHWMQLVGAVLFLLGSVVGMILFGAFSSLSANKKALAISVVAIIEAIIIKFLAIRMALVLRRGTHIGLEIQGYTVAQWKRRQERQAKAKALLHQTFTSSSSSSSSAPKDSEEAVHYHAASVGVGVGMAGGGGASVEKPFQSTISVDITSH